MPVNTGATTVGLQPISPLSAVVHYRRLSIPGPLFVFETGTAALLQWSVYVAVHVWVYAQPLICGPVVVTFGVIVPSQLSVPVIQADNNRVAGKGTT